MSVVKIRGIDVRFPYEKPYDIQITYMDKVIQCLEEKRHGVLESPTGTGKTLCLFSPVTSWLQAKKSRGAIHDETGGNVSWGCRQKVWYTARTHSQIAQTVAEVRRCDIEGLSVRVMGARDQLCVNPLVANEKESHIKTAKCKELVKTRSCRFYKNLDYAKVAPAIYQPGEILDIEDLVAAGRSCGVCPYFLAKTAKDSADIVLMPYNYVIDRDSRGSTGAAGENDIVIFDEGHNVPNTCEESYEFSVTSVNLALGMRNIQELMEALVNMKQYEIGSEDDVDIATHASNCMLVAEVLKGLEAGFSEIPASPQLYPLKDLFGLFAKAGVNDQTAPNLLSVIAQFQADSIRLQLSGPMVTTFTHLTKMIETLFGSAIKSFTSEMIEKSFKFVVAPDIYVKNAKKLSLYCFNPSFGIKEVLLLGVQSMVITSGTLSPLKSFIYELGLPDPITLENGHIASKSQVPFMILGTGVNNVKMDAAFKNRNDSAYVYSLGMSLTNLISSVPDGVLLLFSSYSMMQSLKENWEKEGGIWSRLNAIKRVFIEPREKEEFINCMENYRRAIDAGNGALLMGVLRGKISEGMDFKDQYCRAVFVVGVPFPPVTDPRVKGKEKYAETLFVSDPHTNKNEKLYDNSFMSVEAMKATNQAIGRVIRHGGDYGAIVLVDYRFAWPRLFTNISRWLRGSSPSEVNFMTAKKTLREFFKNMHLGNLGVPEIRRQAVNSNGDPMAGDIKYDVYDHKKARHAPAPWLASAAADDVYKRNNFAYEEDLPASDSLGELVSKYKKKEKSLAAQTKNKMEPTSFLDALDSGDAVIRQQSAYTAYREVNLSLLDSEQQKRKGDELCLPLLSSQKKKARRRNTTQVDMEHVPEPEPEPAPVAKSSVKTDIINYITQTKNSLPSDKALQLKETAWKYMKGESTLNETYTSLESIFQDMPSNHGMLLGFSVCVRPRDRDLWDKLTKALR